MSAESNAEGRDPGLVWAYALPTCLALSLALVLVHAPAFTFLIALGGAMVSSIMCAKNYRGVFAALTVIACTAFFVLAGLSTVMELTAGQ